jgi:Protein of unknown function (DUF2384)
MTKEDVIAEIAGKTGIEKTEVAKTLESLFTVVKEVKESVPNTRKPFRYLTEKYLVLTDKSQTELYQHGEAVFENIVHFQTWLERPNAALSQQRPIDLIATEEGAKEVDDLLTRLEYGVY